MSLADYQLVTQNLEKVRGMLDPDEDGDALAQVEHLERSIGWAIDSLERERDEAHANGQRDGEEDGHEAAWREVGKEVDAITYEAEGQRIEGKAADDITAYLMDAIQALG